MTSSRLHVFRVPAAGQYIESYTAEKSEVIRPVAFEDVAIALTQLVWPDPL